MARVPYVTEKDLPPEYEDYIQLRGDYLHILQAVGNNPELLVGFAQFYNRMYRNAGLTGRERELIILAIASSLESEYMWHHHVDWGKDVGISEDEILAISRGDLDPFPENERDMIAYARGVALGSVNDPIHDSLADHYDDGTIIGIVMVASQYVGVGRLLEAVDIELEDGERFVGWDLEGRRGPPSDAGSG